VPEVFRDNGLRYFFYSNEGNPLEPPHVHVERDDAEAKFWLDPVDLAENWGLKPADLKRARDTIVDRRGEILEKWNEKFGPRR